MRQDDLDPARCIYNATTGGCLLWIIVAIVFILILRY